MSEFSSGYLSSSNSSVSMSFVVLLCLAIAPLATLALDNGLALTPPMGWMSWTRFMCQINCDAMPDHCIRETLFTQMADRLVNDGYKAVGYNRIHVDDCWLQKQRDSKTGRLKADGDRFASGMKWLGEYVSGRNGAYALTSHGTPPVCESRMKATIQIHGRGLEYGMYATFGNKTCMGFAGTRMEDMHIDAQTFLDWKIDYLKLDGCFNYPKDLQPAYIRMGQELKATNRSIVYSCSWPFYLLTNKIQPNYSLIVKHCNLWRNFDDISVSWKSVLGIIDYYDKNQNHFAKFHGPGHWNDPDMLIIGNPGITIGQARVQMAIWCIWSAPLVMSNDLRALEPGTKEILQNKMLIAVDQDPLGIMGKKIMTVNSVSIYRKPVTPVDDTFVPPTLTHYSFAFVFFNRDAKKTASDTVLASELGLNHPNGYRITDLLTGESVGVVTANTPFPYQVPPEDVYVIKATIMNLPVPRDASESELLSFESHPIVIFIVLCIFLYLFWFCWRHRRRYRLYRLVHRM